MSDQTFSVTIANQNATEGIIVLEPLRQGFGHTLGVALRRVMLGSLSGAAVTKVRVKGVNHQFTTLAGMQEDIVDLILNLKQLRVGYQGDKPETLKLTATGPGAVTAGDLVGPATVKIANPDLVLANLADKKSKLSLELTIESGTGYMTAEEQGKQKLGVIPLDASFSPVREVSYTIESTRVGRRTDYDKLVLSVKTNGTVQPHDAVLQATQILIDHLGQVLSPVSVSAGDDSIAPVSGSDGSVVMKLAVEELDLPTRVANALRKGGYKTVADLAQAGHSEIAKVKNLGEKSVQEIIDKLHEKGVQVAA